MNYYHAATIEHDDLIHHSEPDKRKRRGYSNLNLNNNPVYASVDRKTTIPIKHQQMTVSRKQLGYQRGEQNRRSIEQLPSPLF